MRIESPRIRRERTPFIGRRREREQLRDAMDRGAALISLTGPSGIGKTRLARQMAGELIDSFDDEGGVWFCNLAGCTTPEALEIGVARTLAISQRQGDELLHAISNRGPLLLILDNADSLAAASARLLTRWLDRCVELRMIMTSIVPSGAKGEEVIELQPLELEDAIALYQDRARQAWADRSVPADEGAEVQALVRRLDRLPLAIELAAARVRILPPRTMLSMIEKRFEFLCFSHAQASDAVPRQSSLLGSLDLTWSHLEKHEQLVLARAVVFEHGFSSEAAAAVLWQPPSEGSSASPAIEEILDGLHRKALILQEDSEPPRYQLLESIKEYAFDELRKMGGWDEMIRIHAAYFLARPETQKVYCRGPERADAIPWLQAERANLLAIHRRFLSSAPDLAARAGIALSALLFFEGPSIADQPLIEATLDAAKRSQDLKLILAATEAISLAHFRHGRHEEAKRVMESLVALAREEDEGALEAQTLARLALHYLILNDAPRSREMVRRADQLDSMLELPSFKGNLHFVKGSVAWLSGDLELAEAELQRSVELSREHGQRGSEINPLHNLGLVLTAQGRHLEGRRILLEAIELSRSAGYRSFEAHVLLSLTTSELRAGFLEEAEAAGKQALSIYREDGNLFAEGEVLGQLGVVALERLEFDQASEWLSRADELLGFINASEPAMIFQIFLAALEAKRGQIEEARRLVHQARSRSGDWREKFDPFLELCESLIDVAETRAAAPSHRDRAEAKISRARSRLTEVEINLPLYSYLLVLPRLLETELAQWEAAIPTDHPSLPALKVRPTFDWFQIGEGEPFSLRNRRTLQRVFAALASARLDAPGVVVRPEELIRAGWPEGLDPDAAMKRLHQVIWLLRNQGLRKLLVTDPNGFVLDPKVPIRVEDDDRSVET